MARLRQALLKVFWGLFGNLQYWLFLWTFCHGRAGIPAHVQAR